MPLTQAQKRAEVRAALVEQLPYEGEGVDRRTLVDLRKEFERQYLGGVVRAYRAREASVALEVVDIADV